MYEWKVLFENECNSSMKAFEIFTLRNIKHANKINVNKINSFKVKYFF